MEFLENKNRKDFERHKNKIQENIDMGKNMGVNKISAILAIADESQEIQTKLINLLLSEGYRISLKEEDCTILTIEW